MWKLLQTEISYYRNGLTALAAVHLLLVALPLLLSELTVSNMIDISLGVAVIIIFRINIYGDMRDRLHNVLPIRQAENRIAELLFLGMVSGMFLLAWFALLLLYPQRTGGENALTLIARFCAVHVILLGFEIHVDLHISRRTHLLNAFLGFFTLVFIAIVLLGLLKVWEPYDLWRQREVTEAVVMALLLIFFVILDIVVYRSRGSYLTYNVHVLRRALKG